MIPVVEPPSAEQIEAAGRVVAEHLLETPTVTVTIDGRSVLVKLELLQPTGSFKVRGALAALDALKRHDPDAMVITSSAGNHGLGIAYAASVLGVGAVVVVPENASPVKVAKLRGFEIELLQHGHSYDEAQQFALAQARERELHYVSPFNNTHVIAGQATVMLEMLRQAAQLDHLVVSVGGGGLISGCLLARRLVGRDDLAVTGVQPANSAAMYHVLRGVRMADVTHTPTIADGLAGGGDEDAATNAVIADAGVELILVDESTIRTSVRDALFSTGLLLEGSAAASYGAIAHRQCASDAAFPGFIATGRNIAPTLLDELLVASA
jgi:threonine dehydratase